MGTDLDSIFDRVRRPSARALVAGALLLAVLLAAMAYAGLRWQARTGADEAPRTVEASAGGTLAVLSEQRAEWHAVCGEAEKLYAPGLPADDARGRAEKLVARNEAIMGQVRRRVPAMHGMRGMEFACRLVCGPDPNRLTKASCIGHA